MHRHSLRLSPFLSYVWILRHNVLRVSSLAISAAVDYIRHYLNFHTFDIISNISSPTMSSTPAIPPFSLRLAEGLTLGLGLGTTALLVTIRLWTKLRLVGNMLPEDCEYTMRTRNRHANNSRHFPGSLCTPAMKLHSEFYWLIWCWLAGIRWWDVFVDGNNH